MDTEVKSLYYCAEASETLKSFLKVIFLAFYNHDSDLPIGPSLRILLHFMLLTNFWVDNIFVNKDNYYVHFKKYNVSLVFRFCYLQANFILSVYKSQIINKLALHLVYNF